MAAEADHVALANRHHAALTHLCQNGEEFPEWIATIAFYKALQLVDASFAFTGSGRASDHGSRLDILKRTHRYSHVFKHFRPLYSASRVGRYMMDERGRAYKNFADFLNGKKVIGEMVNHRLLEVEESLVASGFLSQRSIDSITKIKRDQSSSPSKQSIPTNEQHGESAGA